MKQHRLRRFPRLQVGRFWRLLRRSRVALGFTVTVLILLTLGSRIGVAYLLANDAPGDGVVYARMATNLLEHGVFSEDDQEPVTPTMIRTPGYPIFLAGVYYVFGEGNNSAVRIVQAVFDTATCIVAALLAGMWTSRLRRRRAALWTYILASLCPFIVIYTATILTETLTTFFMAASALTATLALRSRSWPRAGLWWAVSGLLCGAGVMLRPDAGLFAAGIGTALVIAEVFWARGERRQLTNGVFAALWKGSVLSLAFLLVLTPWTLRNWRLWGVFQPISPAHAEMPGEFVPFGYNRWLKTWVDDSRYTEPMLWNLGEKQISLSAVRPNSFDSPEERQEVASLLGQYNNPPGSNNPKAMDEDSSGEDDGSSTADGDTDQSSDEAGTDDADQSDENGGEDTYDETPQIVKMTPEIDAGFGRIADERITRSPMRYYLWLPLKRAGALWFDSHSLYWPFGGQLSKIADLDHDENQQYWLPIFTLLTWVYTAVAVLGMLAMWRDIAMRKWLILVALLALPRVIFLSTVENPEPRYVVELFIFTAVAGGIWLSGRRRRCTPRGLGESRVKSIDVFRGITIAAMTLVNEPGTWDSVYPPLLHAEWNGATPADWIFPFFLFIVGVSITYAFGKFARDEAPKGIYKKIIRRSLLLFGFGLLLNIFPVYNIWTGLWFEPSHVRIMGVLQRIAICYAVVAVLFLKTSWRTQAIVAAALLLGYWGMMALISPPGCSLGSSTDIQCNLAGYVDQLVLGRDHMWEQSQVVDPEGLLSTVPAIATTILGMLTGQWLRSDANKKVSRMLFSGAIIFVTGCVWSLTFALNKTLWTSSYVLYTGGLAVISLASLYWLVDLKGWNKWASPFLVFGTNAIALYVGSSLLGMSLGIVELEAPNDTTQTLQERIFANWFAPYADPLNASLLYAVAFLAVWLVIIWMLYRKRIFLKV